MAFTGDRPNRPMQARRRNHCARPWSVAVAVGAYSRGSAVRPISAGMAESTLGMPLKQRPAQTLGEWEEQLTGKRVVIHLEHPQRLHASNDCQSRGGGRMGGLNRYQNVQRYIYALLPVRWCAGSLGWDPVGIGITLRNR